MKILTPEVRKILSELLAHRKTLVVVAITGLLMAAAETRYVMSLKDLVEGFESKDRSQVVASMLMILGLALVKGVAQYFHLFEMNWISEQVAQTFRQKLQSQFMRFSLSFHNNFATGSGGLISRILNDIVVIQHGLRMFADLFREPVTLFALIVWLFYLDWQLTCFVILVLPLVLLFLRTLSKGIKKHSLKGQIDLESVSSTIKETIDGVRIIQSFNLQSEMERRFHADSHEFLNSRRRTHRLVEMSGPVTEFIMTALILGIVPIWFSKWLRVEKPLEPTRATVWLCWFWGLRCANCKKPMCAFKKSSSPRRGPTPCWIRKKSCRSLRSQNLFRKIGKRLSTKMSH